MEKTMRRFTSHDRLHDAAYLYWHSRPDSEIFETIWQMSRDAYRDYDRLKGITRDGTGSARSFTRIQRAIR